MSNFRIRVDVGETSMYKNQL